MKKIYILLILSFFLQTKAQSVIYSHTVPNYSGAAGFSSYLANNGDMISMASSFTLTQTSEITTINLYGSQISDNLPAMVKGMILYIYSDNNGAPSGNPLLQTGIPVISLDINNSTQGYNIIHTAQYIYTFSVDISALPGTAVLQGNTKYWLFFVPRINLDSMILTSPQKFNWWLSPTAAPDYARISNLTGGAAYPTWQVIPNTGAAFSIEGMIMGTHEVVYDSSEIKVFPNPTTRFLEVTSKDKIRQIALYDGNGKKIPVKLADHKVDFEGLSAGNYFLSIETEKGTVTKKIIKR
ncbi:hypothetical protein ASG21_19325 [Chryseobacterium sp. Leaf394]|nr:hypothetical protein ASG21_19325 [Chryseobacterium sp. Leaf394]